MIVREATFLLVEPRRGNLQNLPDRSACEDELADLTVPGILQVKFDADPLVGKLSYLGQNLSEVVHIVSMPQNPIIANCVNATYTLKKFVEIFHAVDSRNMVNIIDTQ